MTATSLTQSQIRAGLTIPNIFLGPGQFTFSIPNASSSWSDYAAGSQPFSDYSGLSAGQAGYFRQALAAWDSLILPDFTEVTETAAARGEIRIAFTSFDMDPWTAGYAFLPTSQVPTSEVGDIWLNATTAGSADHFRPGQDGYTTLLHELGHTIGLKHSFEGPTPLPADFDSERFTVMSYTPLQQFLITFVLGDGGNSITSHFARPAPATPMVADIAAVQLLYGADPQTHAGNTIHRPDQNDPTLRALYDASGIDTIDLSAFTRPNIVDLTPGAYSSIGLWSAADQKAYWTQQFPDFSDFIAGTFDANDVYTWSDNFGIAFSTVIENANGGSAADMLTGNLASNRLSGNGGNDRIDGRAGNDILDGGAGSDRLTGGTGVDTVSYASASAAVTVRLDLTGAQNTGGGGSDTLATIENAVGSRFADTLGGDGAANMLDGGRGADMMRGGAGNDIYVVDNAGDRTIEGPGAGIDLVKSAITFALGANLEKLTLIGSAEINGFGNALANSIVGNGAANILSGGDGADILDGKGGADSMRGGNGNDRYVVHSANDGIVEVAGAGTDIVSALVSYRLGANVEQLKLIGMGTDRAIGNTLANTITGNAAANLLYGREGNDSLTGGGGADRFVFDTALSGTLNVDRILDFSAAADTIVLDRTIFSGLSANGRLPAGAFVSGTVAQDTDDRILHDSATGNIYYDSDGLGGAAAVLFARVDAGLILTSADFVGVA